MVFTSKQVCSDFLAPDLKLTDFLYNFSSCQNVDS
jgi:hypothetical protein